MREATIFTSSCPSVGMKQTGSHWTIFAKFCVLDFYSDLLGIFSFRETRTQLSGCVSF
jgi:hypothetical protein